VQKPGQRFQRRIDPDSPFALRQRLTLLGSVLFALTCAFGSVGSRGWIFHPDILRYVASVLSRNGC